MSLSGFKHTGDWEEAELRNCWTESWNCEWLDVWTGRVVIYRASSHVRRENVLSVHHSVCPGGQRTLGLVQGVLQLREEKLNFTIIDCVEMLSVRERTDMTNLQCNHRLLSPLLSPTYRVNIRTSSVSTTARSSHSLQQNSIWSELCGIGLFPDWRATCRTSWLLFSSLLFSSLLFSSLLFSSLSVPLLWLGGPFCADTNLTSVNYSIDNLRRGYFMKNAWCNWHFS